MITNPKLTVAIPTFNRETYLGQVLESLKAQSEQSFNVIIFDNASSYDIESLISRFPSLSISLERNAINMGNQANFERVMKHVYSAPYVMIFHDDDTIHPNYFKDALKILEGNQKLNWLGSYITYTHDDNKMQCFRESPADVQFEVYTKQELANAFMHNAPIGFSSVIYKKEALAVTSPDAPRFHKWLDRPFMLEACANGTVAIMTFPYINYRIHASQDSAQSYRNHIPEMVNLIEYLSITGSANIKTKVFSTTSALRAAAINAQSIHDFSVILKIFTARDLFSLRYLRPYSLAWLFWLIWKRLRNYLLSR